MRITAKVDYAVRAALCLAKWGGDGRYVKIREVAQAMALPAKLMIPLILFIFPCLMGVLILPAGFRISQTLMQ